MLKILSLAVAAALAVVLVAAATRPDSFRVQRSADIQAAPEKVYAYIDDFRQWRAWSPYENLDPAMQRELSGAASGRGAVYAWRSEGKAGMGRMEITESSQPQRLLIRLDFAEPMVAHNMAEFTLEPRSGGTRVTWAMHGPQPYVAKLLGLFFNVDQLVGQDFEAGLGKLKQLAER